MAECPDGHRNPAGWEFCGECGQPIDTAADERERTYWDRTRWAIAGIGILVVITVVCLGVVLAVVSNDRNSTPAVSGEIAMDEWVADAGAHVTELETVLNDAQSAMESYDRRGLQTACEDMHEVAAVDLAAHLPSPDPDLTGELTAATEDAHAAAHMCLASMAESLAPYSGEFMTRVEESVRNVAAAQLRIKRALHNSQ